METVLSLNPIYQYNAVFNENFTPAWLPYEGIIMNYFPFRKRCARNASSFASFVWYPKWRWRCLITKITVVLERSDAINVLIGYNCENGTATKIATIPICSADFANVQLSRKLKLSSITMPVSLRHTESTNQFRFEYQPEKIPN